MHRSGEEGEEGVRQAGDHPKEGEEGVPQAGDAPEAHHGRGEAHPEEELCQAGNADPEKVGDEGQGRAQPEEDEVRQEGHGVGRELSRHEDGEDEEYFIMMSIL